jgi:hypothetical protein
MAGSDPRLTPPAADRRQLPILWRGRAGGLALLAALLLHILVGQQVGELIAPIDTRAPPMQRIQAAYTRRVAQAEPPEPAAATGAARRSEERRVGKECRRLCRSRWSPYH